MRAIALLALVFYLPYAAAAAEGQCRCRMPAALSQEKSEFSLKDDSGFLCAPRAVIDVNQGNAPKEAVRRLYCQITGAEPPPSASALAEKLGTDPRMRRVDAALQICAEAGRTCELAFSSPWQKNVEAAAPLCDRKNARDAGAVLMFFFYCPGETNCEMGWANNHAFGMETPDPLLGGNYYNADAVGFWTRELRDARYAGLQFVLPNVYGPDMIEEGKLKVLAKALNIEGNAVKIGLFDDTWEWGQPYFGKKWSTIPDLSDTENAAATLYTSKWKPFFTEIADKYLYKLNGKPVIYFYNAGTLTPRTAAAPVIARMKDMFAADFGVRPYVVVDTAFFDDPRMDAVADGRFTWNSLEPAAPGGAYRFVGAGGIKLGSAMPRWDSVGRDLPGRAATAEDRLIKGDELLKKVLANTSDLDVLLFATWNDLGEGTGINRAYDYYYKGKWLPPDHFMRVIRAAQCKN